MVSLSYKVFFLASLPFWSLAFTGFTTLSEGTRDEESNLLRGMKKKAWIEKARERVRSRGDAYASSLSIGFLSFVVSIKGQG